MLGSILLRKLLTIFLPLLINYPIQRALINLHPIFNVINTGHLFLYNTLFLLIMIVKILRKVYNFNIFWNYIFDDTHILIFSYLYELAIVIYYGWNDPIIWLALLYKFYLINITDYISKNLAVPVLLSWSLVRNIHWYNLNIMDIFNWKISLILLLLVLRPIFLSFLEPDFKVSVSGVIPPQMILDIPWDFRSIKDKLSNINFDSSYVPFHVMLFAYSIEGNLGIELVWNNIFTWLLLFVLTLIQVYMECLQIDRFDLILKQQQSMIKGIRPGYQTKSFLKRIFVKMIILNYFQVILLYQLRIWYPNLISFYNLLIQFNLLRKLWVFQYLYLHNRSKGRKMNDQEILHFWKILGSIYGL